MPDDVSARIVVTTDGPYRVEGGVPLSQQVIGVDAEGASREWLQARTYDVSGSYELCRCGQTSSAPFCDSTHFMAAFDGTETASRDDYVDQAVGFDGPVLALTDAESFCAYARFCDPDGSVWALVEQTDDPATREKVIKMSGACPSGRLLAWDKETGQPIEPAHTPAIGAVEDPAESISGPLWVQGGIRIESEDGTPYEVRNRVTVCRCGASGNKPFCDGSHASVKFKAMG